MGMLTDVVAPMVKSSTEIRNLASGHDTNCKSVRSIFLQGSRALGNDFVSAYTVLWMCTLFLSICSVGLVILYCMLWGLYQRGQAPGKVRQPRTLLNADSGSTSDDECDSDEESHGLLKSKRS